MQKHEFAFYLEKTDLFASKKAGDFFLIEDAKMVHRMDMVLRLAAQDSIILFDEHTHAYATIQTITRHAVAVKINSYAPNVVLKPTVTVLLPILKKDAFEQAIYSCVELGAHEIQFVQTDKAHRVLRTQEWQRMRTIMIAAAEQSKQFNIPVMKEAIPLQKAVENYADAYSMVSTIQGKPLSCVLPTLSLEKSIALFFGPEGDFSQAEYTLFEQNKSVLCRLTPTVLRSQQAIVILLGAIRSWVCSTSREIP